MVQFVNLHRHDTYSLFDGFGTAKQAAEYAKELGQPALGLTNHGNVSGLVNHYFACKDAGIKPILGVEGYFQPRFDPAKRRFHLTIFCENMTGYRNLMRMLTYVNREQFYRYPIIDLETLKMYSDGLIILSGCIAGYIPALILAGRTVDATKAARVFKGIFGNRFYLEIQPIDVGDKQRIVNARLFDISQATGVPTVMTLDSHYVRPEEYPTYEAMYKIAGREPHVDYSARAMLDVKAITRHWSQMFSRRSNPEQFMETTLEIADRCNVELEFKEVIPRIDWGEPSDAKLSNLVLDFVRKYCVVLKPKRRQKYWDRANRELAVIIEKGFQDYFLLCYDIVQKADKSGIARGFGRGSVCGSLVAFALGLTMVDPLLFGTSFERFMRPDKMVMPDIDMDFGSDRRHELKDYLLRRFEGKSSPISTTGYYRARGLWNDLAKLYEVDRDDTEQIKNFLELMVAGDQAGAFAEIDLAALESYPEIRKLNRKYKGIMQHFCLLYGQANYLGEHPAGIAVSAKRIDNYVTIMRIGKDAQTGEPKYLTAYDMDALSKLGIVKIDILGLATASILRACEDKTGVKFSYKMLLKDAGLYEEFVKGNTEGIFQFERGGIKKIMEQVQPANFLELAACNAMNRPGTTPNVERYVAGKFGNVEENQPWSQFTKETYGALIYQEQVMQVCRAAGLEWSDADKVMKSVNAKAVDPVLLDKFVAGASKAFGISRAAARGLYRRSTLYLFNKSHAVGYTLVALYQMYFKIYHPLEFWWATLRYEKDDYKRRIYQACAIRAGVVILPAHINGTAEYSIEEIEDAGFAIRAGLSSLKGVGVKAATAIEANKPYDDESQILSKLTKRQLNKATYEVLRREGALEFDPAKIEHMIVSSNAFLYGQELAVR